MAVEVIKKKTHTTVEGLNKILSLKASINNGLSPALKEAFPKVIPVQRPLVVDQEIKDPTPFLKELGLDPPLGGWILTE